MYNINVTLESHLPIKNIITGARVCWKSFEKDDYVSENFIGVNNKKLINNLLIHEHLSVFEHMIFTFKIQNISRLTLQELVRHRTGKFSVESTRYVLKKDLLQYGKYFENKQAANISEKFRIISQFLTIPLVKYYVSHDVLHQFETLTIMYLKIKAGVKNDIVKYMLPENWRVRNLLFTIDVRNLRNFFKLRLSNRAHFEIRYLAYLILQTLPEIYKEILFNDLIKNFCNEHQIASEKFSDKYYVLKKIIGEDIFKDIYKEYDQNTSIKG